MLRISTTTLETFRRCSDTGWGKEQDLVANIAGEPYQLSWQAMAGAAFQCILSYGKDPPNSLGFVERDGFWFSADDILIAEDHIGHGGLWEVKGTKTIRIDGEDVTFVAKADNVRGEIIQENKCKFYPAPTSDYDESLQWKFYLWILEGSHVRYNFFQYSFKKSPAGQEPKHGTCHLKNIISVHFWPYPELEKDCVQWAKRLISWCERKNILHHLRMPGGTPSVEDALGSK